MAVIHEILERFTNARVNAKEEIDYLKANGRKIVGTYCSFAPREIILAAGAVPIRLTDTTSQYDNEGEKDIPRNMCTIVKSSYGAAVSGKSPYFDKVDIIIGETTCDGKKKMFEYLKNIKNTYVMQVPQKSEGEDEYSLWKNEILRLKELLEKEFHVEITDKKIKEAIVKKNNERRTLKRLYKLWGTKPSELNSKDIHNVLFNFEYRMDSEKALEDIESLIEILEDSNVEAKQNKAPKILLTGCPLGEKFPTIIDLIEEAGGDLVVIETCDWMKGNEELVDESISWLDALTQKYLKVACPTMTPNTYRYENISRYIDEDEIDGVINLDLQACVPYNIESIPLKRFVNEKKDVGYINLETNMTAEEVGQVRTRIEAFVEML
ncbi:2-hydroxyacyl-CoA dehydratase [Tissierella creatinini]|nr:2-hydroxyacyl-CoA dehydratase [Tissierella creatinini]TJX64590.1 2-hydroxyacyl-CoA dehydratase [Soehngenia saccharolytica]